MSPIDLQQWLGAHGQPVVVDGSPGPKTRAAIRAAFVNKCAAEVSDADIIVLASRLGCTAKQIKAVATVESGGKAFDSEGRPKILFERHLFHKLTNGEFTPASFSNPKGGGYGEDSWEKLTQAACRDADAAFCSTSWGKFQVLGRHWQLLGYPSPIDMAYTTVIDEAAHYEMLARYIEKNSLAPALRALSTDAQLNRSFAKGYNGPAYEDFQYHVKLAWAMR